MPQQNAIAKKEAQVVIKYCPVKEHVADTFTKPLKNELLYKLKMLEMISLEV